MNIHEYQAKELCREFGINVSNGALALSADEAVEVAKKLGGNVWAVKTVYVQAQWLGAEIKRGITH